MKRILSLIIAVVMPLALLCGCGIENDADKNRPSFVIQTDKEKDITINVLQNKVEIADVLKKMEADYEKENPGVKLRFETFGGGVDYHSGLFAKFQSGEAPDVFINEGFAILDPWLEKIEDLSDQPWVKDMLDGSAAPVTKNGKLYGMPEAVEGFGFAYNKTLFTKAGITTLPNTLTTLENACKKLQEAGIQPFSNSYAEWWVLGMHNFNIPLVHQPDSQKFIDNIAAKKIKFKDNAIAAGWVKLLDLTVKYGQSDPTTTGDYVTSVAVFSSGKAAMIQQGNWIQPDLDKVDVNLDVGFIPMPISDTPEEKINAGIPNFWIINKESNVKQEAKTWLNWMVSSETGKRYIKNELKFIPAFKSIKDTNLKGLNAALFEYISAGKTYGWEFPRLPGGATEIIGNSIMKYLGKQSTNGELYESIDNAIAEKVANAKK